MYALGSHGNLGAPVVSIENRGEPVRDPGRPKPRPAGARTPPTWERTRGYAVVPTNEGNEVTRDGRQGVGAFHMTCEGGELAPGDPPEERERRSHET